VSGTVMSLTANTIGGVLAPGSQILEIVPKEEELIVEAQLRPVDVDRVSAGLPADVRFSAFNRSTTPVVPAQVLTISADSVVDQQTGVAYYLARVRITDEGLKELEDLELVPGMPAEVMINTGSKSVLAYLVQPISNAFARSLRED